jgi:hypothetical protein
VRVAPHEVSFTSPEGVKEIYGAGSTFPKSHFYDLFQYSGERNMFTTLTKKEYGDRKKITVRYTKSYVMQAAIEAPVRELSRDFMTAIAKYKVLDIYVYLHYYALEYVQGFELH